MRPPRGFSAGAHSIDLIEKPDQRPGEPLVLQGCHPQKNRERQRGNAELHVVPPKMGAAVVQLNESDGTIGKSDVDK